MIRVPTSFIRHATARLLWAGGMLLALSVPAAAATSGLLGVYYGDTTLTAVAAVHKGEGLNFAWNGGQPDAAVPGSYWSGRWQGSLIAPGTGTYTIYVAADDGVRLKVNGQLLVDKWIAQGLTEYSGTVAMTAGASCPIVIEYYQGNGASGLTLSWAGPSLAKQIIPLSALALPVDAVQPSGITGLAVTHVTDRVVTLGWTAASDNLQLAPYTILRDGAVVGRTGATSFTDTTVSASHAGYSYQVQVADAMGNSGPTSSPVSATTPAAPVNGTGSGLAGTYYNDTELGTAVATRTDAKVDFLWGAGTPLAAVAGPNYSARWQGDIQARYSETYTFTAVVDTDARLVVNGQTVLEAWNWGASTGPAPMPRTVTGSFALSAGQRVPVRLDFARHYGAGEVHLYWQSLSTPKAIIPAAQLYPAPASDPLSDALVSPAASPTSPAWVEGILGSATSSTSATVSGQAVSVVKEGGTRWYATASGGTPPGIPLTAGAGLPLVVTVNDGHGHTAQQTASLTWTTTTIAAGTGAALTVRAGDKLLMTANKAGGGGTTVAIDPAYDGTTFHATYSGPAGTGIAIPFATAATVTVAAQVDGVLIGTRAVTALSVNLQGPIANQVTYQRAKAVLVTPPAAAGSVTFAASTPDRMTVGVSGTTATGANLTIRSLYLTPGGVQARIGGVNGPLLAQQVVDGFLLSTTAGTGMTYVQTFADGSVMAQATMTMTPLVGSLDVKISCIVSGVTFDDSTTVRTVGSSTFTAAGANGTYLYRMVLAANKSSHFCHTTHVYQNGVQISN